MKKLILILFLLPLFCFGQFTGGSLSTNDAVITGATITSNVLLTGQRVQFINCTFTSGAKILIKGIIDGLTVTNFTSGTQGLVDLSTIAVSYRTSGYALQHVVIDGGTMTGGVVFQGNFGTYGINNWVKTIEIKNVTRTGTNGAFVSAAMMFDYDIHNNRTVYSDQVDDGGDFGVYNINGGNGRIHDNYRSGGWGWLVRGFNCSVIGDARDALYYNNIDLNHNEYGCIDMRSEAAASISGATDLCQPTNIRAFNNTCGNLRENKFGTNNYSNAAVLVASVQTGAGFEAEIRNNLSFNVITKGYQGSELGGSNTNVGSFAIAIPKCTNNKYYSTSILAGLVDDVNCFLASTSPAIDAGITTSFVTTDIDGIARPQQSAYDIGAKEYHATASCPGCGFHNRQIVAQ